jgi:hypothetical protein
LHSFSKYISSVVMVTAAPMISLLSATSNESSSGTCVPHIITLDCSSPVLRASPKWKKKIEEPWMKQFNKVEQNSIDKTFD